MRQRETDRQTDRQTEGEREREREREIEREREREREQVILTKKNCPEESKCREKLTEFLENT